MAQSASPLVGTRALERRAEYRAVRQLPLFDGVSNETITLAIERGELSHFTFVRDDLVSDTDSVRKGGGRSLFVLHGQVGIALFSSRVLAEEWAWSLSTPSQEKIKKVRTRGPLLRRAEKNLAIFGEGDLLHTQALSGPGIEDCAVFAVTSSEMLSLSPALLSTLATRYDFFAHRLRRASQLVSERLQGIRGLKQEIFDFYVRHGLSVATTLRVRNVDRCIECKSCEMACAKRHGHARLAIHGVRLGMLDFVYSCRTCTDPRCIEPCNFDSIRLDPAVGEVVIHAETCTGCGACAVACPFGAIELIPRSEDNAGDPPLPPRKIASKCDHCASQKDRACISQCPTGALVEISPRDLFHDQSELAKSAAATGYDQTVWLDNQEMLPEEHFEKGLGLLGTQVRRRRQRVGWSWILGGLGFGLALVEIMLRRSSPEASLQHALLRLDGVDPLLARHMVSFHAGCDLAVNLGYVGTALMTLSMVYPLCRRVTALRFISTSATWFDLHVMGGVVGPLFILLHSALKLDNWVSVAFWVLVLVVLSGLIGRYLYTQIPELLHGRELEELAAERALARMRLTYRDAIDTLEGEIAAHRKQALAVARRAGLTATLGWLLIDDLARPSRAVLRWRRLRRLVPTRMRAEATHAASRLILANRRRLLVPRLMEVLAHWRKLHAPFAVVLFILVAIHVLVASMYSM